jgi:hypothetical protein
MRWPAPTLTALPSGSSPPPNVHVAAVLDQAGRLLGTAGFPATTRGYARLATWAESFGTVDEVGMEGAGRFGAGLPAKDYVTLRTAEGR